MGNYKGRMLKTRPIGSGYPAVVFTGQDRRETRYVHELVTGAFLGPRPKGLEVCHFDEDKANNRLENLRYDTRQQNARDYWANKRRSA